MSSTVTTVTSENFEFQINRYLPTLEAAPDLLETNQQLKQMPALTARPSVSSIKQRRHSEYSSPKTQNNFPNANVPRKRRRNKQEWHLEFINKQREEFSKFSGTSQEQKLSSFPRIKTVYHQFYEIANMAFASFHQSNIFKCLTASCGYKTPDLSKFESHLKTFHKGNQVFESDARCQICDAVLSHLCEEFEHMKSHLSKQSEDISLDELIDTLSAERSSPVLATGSTAKGISDMNSTAFSSREELNEVYDEIESKLKMIHDGAAVISSKPIILSVEILPNYETITKNITIPDAEYLSNNYDELPVKPKRRSSLDILMKIQTDFSPEDIGILLQKPKSVPIENKGSEACKTTVLKKEIESPQKFVEIPSTNSTLNRHISIDSKPPEQRVFKRSLSVVNGLNQQSEAMKDTQVKPTKICKTERSSTGSQIKTARSEYIDQLIGDEKAAQSNVSHQQSCTPPQSPPNQQESQINLTESSLDSMKKSSSAEVMPWLDSKFLRTNFKYEVVYNKMKLHSNLVKLFKCMDPMCSFTTDKDELFFNHLNRHKADTNRKDNFFLYCSYCNLRATQTKDLVHHVNDVHSFDTYQCSYCFYRSREKESCYQHGVQTHKGSKITLLQSIIVPKVTEKTQQEMMARLKRKRDSNVPPITCILCDAGFYVINEVFAHYDEHFSNLEGTENCEQQIYVLTCSLMELKKLLDSKVVGKVQCLFCKHGESTMDEISFHMAEHPSEPHYCCVRERPANTKLATSSIEAAPIKRIKTSAEIILIDRRKSTEDDYFKRIVDESLALLLPPSQGSHYKKK